MVLGVCRQLVGDRQHAEDAFQAVFLVLARKARSIRDPDLLGNWLYGVALRTAAGHGPARPPAQNEETGTMSVRLRRSIEPSVPPAEEAVMAREEAEALHLEIERLPEVVPPAGRPVLLRGPHDPRGRAAAAVAARHGPQSDGPGAG